MLVEELQNEFGEHRVEKIKFTAPIKEQMASRHVGYMEDRRVRVPDDPRIRESFHKVRKVVTAAGNVRYDAASTAIGHADRFWTKSLAFMAGHDPAAKPTIEWL